MNDAHQPTGEGKGRPTPTRKEAEALRKQQMKKPVTRKEQSARDRQSRSGARQRELDALNGKGDQRYLPARDHGPAKALTRDYVDRRITVAEFMLPIVVVVLVVSLVPNDAVKLAVTWIWGTLILLTVLDETLLVLGLRRELNKRFTKTESRGCGFYAVMRSTQLRVTRRPRAVIRRGAELRERY